MIFCKSAQKENVILTFFNEPAMKNVEDFVHICSFRHLCSEVRINQAIDKYAHSRCRTPIRIKRKTSS